ncbi:hypothetical protein GO730_02050 [Spirosoma sp. HMF3257]|nr:hypothetical protein [Spirosoma telluris]
MGQILDGPVDDLFRQFRLAFGNGQCANCQPGMTHLRPVKIAIYPASVPLQHLQRWQ